MAVARDILSGDRCNVQVSEMRTLRFLWVAAVAATLILMAGTVVQAQTSFTPVSIGVAQVYESSVAWGDYNNDGLLDFALVGSQDTVGSPRFDTSKAVAIVYQNNGDGSFTPHSAGLMPVAIGSVVWGDFDNDGYLDLLYGGIDTTNTFVTKLYHNNAGNGTFTEVTGANIHPSAYGSVACGDYDNDGWLDILITGFDVAAPATKLYHNNHNGTFTEVTTAGLIGVNGHGKAYFGDYDNDGYPDIVLCGRTNPGTWVDPRPMTKVYHNNRGNGTFTEDTAAHLVGVTRGIALWGDFNNDGYLDLFVAGYTGQVDSIAVAPDTSIVYLNNGGNGSFTPSTSVLGIPGLSQLSAAIGDINGDGKLDILANGYNSNHDVFLGHDNGTFLSANLGDPEVAIGGVALGDYNGDGYLDAIVSGTKVGVSVNASKVFINTSSGSSASFAVNVRPNAPTGLRAVGDSTSVSLSWSPATDATTPQGSLTYAIRVGTTHGGSNVVDPMSDSSGHRKVAAPGAQNLDTAWTLHHLAPGVYYWSVQSIDNGYAGSVFAAEGTFSVGKTVLAFSPDSIAFGKVILPGSKTDSIKVKNTGTLFGKVFKKSVSDTSFIVTPDSMTIAAGDSGKFFVRFKPAKADTVHATLVLSDNLAVNDTVRLSGIGINPGVAGVTPGSISFDSVLVFLTKKDSVKVKNTGGTPVQVVAKRAGADSASFTVTPDTMTVSGGDSTKFFVTFAPTAVRTYAARILFQSAGKTDTVTLTGTGKIMTLAALRKAPVGTVGSFQGVVTRAKGSYTYLQDSTGGMVLYQPTGAFHDTVRSGFIASKDRLLISGKTSVSNNLTEIATTDLGGWLRVARGDSVAPATVTLTQLKTDGEKYESMLVRVVQLHLVGNADTLFKAAKTYTIQGPGDTTHAVALQIPNAGDSDVDSTVINKPTSTKSWLFTFKGVVGQFSSSFSSKGYQLMAVSAGDIHFDSLVTGVPEGSLAGEEAVPTVYSLSQNYPNPFNPSTKIEFALPKGSSVELKVYTMLGQEVATLVQETMSAGRHTVSFNAGRLASGLYFYRISAGDFSSVKKMMLVK